MTVETDERAGSVVLRETVRYPSLLTDHRPTERSRYVRFDRAAGWRPVEVEVRDEPQWKRAELEWAACKDGVWRPTKVTITHGYRNEQYVAAQNPDGRSLVIGYLIDPASWTHKADEMEAALSFTRPEGVRVTAIGPAPNMMIQDYKGEL